MMTYSEAVKYLDSFIDYEKILKYAYPQSLTLKRVAGLLRILNNPQDGLKCIHIAGTKGKGSTCAFIAHILSEAQFRVGLYTSPHLSDFRERIRILEPTPNTQNPRSDFEGMISREELIALVKNLKPNIEKYNSQSKHGALTFFEIYTALAFIYFKEKKVDFCILETGLGGRLDATNKVDPLITAITSISYEHTDQLGKTLTKIASEKAGIIKARLRLATHSSSLTVISAPQKKEAIEVIRKRCKHQDARLYEISKDITFQIVESRSLYQRFNIDGVLGRLTDLKIGLLGRHQIINATLAAAVILALRKFYSARVSLESIKKGLYNTIWPGRFEIIQGKRLVVLDGAQNRASAQALKDVLIEKFPNRRIILLLGISQDKDIRGICQVLIPIGGEVILTQADNPRATDTETIEQILKCQIPNVRCKIAKIRRAEEAMALAQKKARPEDLILVTGSLFLVGELRDLLIKRADSYLSVC